MYHIWIRSRRSGHAERGDTLTKSYLFFPLAFETFGHINRADWDFLSVLSQRLFLVSDDPQETTFLFQRLSVAICSVSIQFVSIALSGT